VALPSWLPKEWSASGSRLILPLQLTFDAGTSGVEEESTLQLAGFTQPRVLSVPSSTQFVSMRGEVDIPTRGVAWGSLPSSSIESLLVWCVDLPEGASKNDVTIPAGRLFFSTRLFQADEVVRLRKVCSELETRVDEGKQAEQTLEGGPLALKSRIEQRQADEARMRRLQRGLPPPGSPVEKLPEEGLWVAREGQLAIKRMVTKLVPWKGIASVPEFGVIGSFNMRLRSSR